MGHRLDTGLWLNDIPVEFVTGLEFRLTRGYEPWVVEIPVSDDRFDNLTNPVTIKFMAPDGQGTSRTVEFKNWYVSAKVVKDEGMYSLILNDPRWIATYNRISVSYNLKWWGETEKWIDHSLNNGAPWLAVDAIRDAVIKFGLDYEDNPDLPASIRSLEFPANVTYAVGGGFFAGSYNEVMPRLLEPINCDLRPTRDGRMLLVDRSSNQSDKLKGYVAVGGRAAARVNKWAKPEEIVLHFARRIEVGLKYDEPTLYSSTSSGNVYDLPNLESEMVMPHVNFPPTGSGLNQVSDDPFYNPDITQIRHREFYQEVKDQLGKGRSWVLENIMRPRVFPFEVNLAGNPMTAEQFFRESTMETWMKQCFRQRFRVRKILLGGINVFSRVADLRMGRVNKQGETADGEGNVFMDYIRINRFSTFPPGKSPFSSGGSYLNAEFSQNFDYNEKIPAPFEARWTTADIDDLLFEVTGKRKRLLDVEYWPGLLRNALRYGDTQDLVDGKPFAEVESTLKLASAFKMLVIAHGTLMTDTGGVTRQYEKAIKTQQGIWAMLPSGSVQGPPLHIRIDDMTANHAYNGLFPGRLINEAEIDKRAEEVAKQVYQSYADGRFGTVTFDGLEPLDEDVATGGDIFDTVVRVGFTNMFTIETAYEIIPEIRQVSGSRADYGTVPVGMIG